FHLGGIHADEKRLFGQQRDWGEVRLRVVAHILHDEWIHRHGGIDGRQDCVAVRRGLRNFLFGDDRVAAWPVDNDDGLAPGRTLLKFLSDDAYHGVATATWRERNDQAHGPVGIGLRERGAGAKERGGDKYG